MVECDNNGSYNSTDEFSVFNDEKMFDISRVQVVRNRIADPLFSPQMKYFYIYHMGRLGMFSIR